MFSSVRQLRHLSFFVALTVALGIEYRHAAAERSTPVTPHGMAIPPAFVRNTGQADAAAQFVALGGGRPMFFTARDVRIVDPARRRSLWLTFVRGNAARLDGDRPTGGEVTWLRGRDEVRRERAYGDVVYRSVWPGVDARVSSTRRGLEYAFEISAGADPSAVRLGYLGVDRAELNGSGELVLEAGGETIVDRAPTAYQRAGERSLPVPVRFVLRDGEITFALGRYDRSRPLVIDPTLVYSTYLGGSGYDSARAIAVDASGATYVAGTTASSDFPTTPGVLQPAFRGGPSTAPRDAFVAKLSADGTRFEYVPISAAAATTRRSA